MLMTPKELLPADLAATASELRAREEPFAFATIVRTAGPTAAKPGAKALLNAEGEVLSGWLGGGCTTGAVRRAAKAAIANGAPQLVSVAPEEVLNASGVSPGDTVAGQQFARNGCPSRGSVDIFIEPCLPAPELAILGTSPVAEALVALAPRFHWALTAAPSAGADPNARVVVVATQGQGDLAALKSALDAGARHIAFVGSGRKFAALAERLTAEGAAPEAVARIKAPAGLDIGAVTPEEIALSILAELVAVRRSPAREVG